VNPARDTVKRGFSWPDTLDLSRATRSRDGVAALANAPAGMTLTGRGEPTQIPMWVVSGNFFDVLCVPAALGRTLGVEHDAPNSPPAATIRFAPDTGRPLDAPQRPSQSPERHNLVVFVVSQDVAHAA
jgi:hypothetical protein